jgi:hypothetical protein
MRKRGRVEERRVRFAADLMSGGREANKEEAGEFEETDLEKRGRLAGGRGGNVKEGDVTHEGLVPDVSTADIDISTNALEDLLERESSVEEEEKRKKRTHIPTELSPQRVQHPRHSHSRRRHHTRNDDRVDLDALKYRRCSGGRAGKGVSKLCRQDGRVDEHGDLEETEDGEGHDVLLLHRVEGDADLEDAVSEKGVSFGKRRGVREDEHCENEEGEVGSNRLEFRLVLERFKRSDVAGRLRERRVSCVLKQRKAKGNAQVVLWRTQERSEREQQ